MSPEIIHWVWDDNPDETLCGKDVEGSSWASDSEPINCEDCLDIERIIVESERQDTHA